MCKIADINAEIWNKARVTVHENDDVNKTF